MSSFQCIIGTEKHLGAEENCNYAFDRGSEAFAEIVSLLKNLAKDDILQPNIMQSDIRFLMFFHMVVLVLTHKFLIYDMSRIHPHFDLKQ